MKNLKKSLKKIQTLLMLVLSIVMATPANVFAATTDLTAGMKKDLVVSELDQTKKETVYVYQVMNVTVEGNQPKSPVYTWKDNNLGKWVYDNYTETVGNKTTHLYAEEIKDGDTVIGYAVTKKFSELQSNGTQIGDFYSALASYIRSNNVAETAKITNTDKAASVTFKNLDLGNYFILVESGSRVYRPTSVNLVPTYVAGEGNKPGKWVVEDGAADVSLKSSTPTIDKKVKGAEQTTAAIGQELTFTIDVLIPDFPKDALAKSIIISDSFKTGLTFKSGSVSVTATDASETSPLPDKNLDKDINYKLEETANGFVVTIDKTKNAQNVEYYETLRGYTHVHVTYTGVINKDAIVLTAAGQTSNINEAKLEYSNDPYNNQHLEEKKDDPVPVYTYGLEVNKKDETGNELKGAKFSVSTAKTLNSDITKDNNVIWFVATDTPGVYRKATSKDEAGATTVLETDEHGKLQVKGLALGKYYVIETEAPEDYVKLQNPVDFELIDDDPDGILDDKASGFYDKDVTNSKSFVLPVTGGMGTLLFSVIGILFMGLGAFLIKNILKKEDDVQ